MIASIVAAWKRLGLFMARVTTPILMLVLFVIVFTPMALVLRLLRRRPLREAFDGSATSYWIPIPARRLTLADFKRPF